MSVLACRQVQSREEQKRTSMETVAPLSSLLPHLSVLSFNRPDTVCVMGTNVA